MFNISSRYNSCEPGWYYAHAMHEPQRAHLLEADKQEAGGLPEPILRDQRAAG